MKLFNRVKFATSTTGTSDIAVGSAEGGFITPAVAGVSNGDQVPYFIEDGDNFAHGLGTYSTSGPTLTRDANEVRWNGSSYSTAKLSLSGDAKVFISPRSVDLSTRTNLTIEIDTANTNIASGAITITNSFMRVDTESGTTDDLDTINGGTDGRVLVLKARNNINTIVVKDGTGNLSLAGDCSLDNAEDTITLIYSGFDSKWLEIARSNNAA